MRLILPDAQDKSKTWREVCCSKFSMMFPFKDHIRSLAHQLKMKSVFPQDKINSIEYLPHIVFMNPKKKHQLKPVVGLSLITLCFGTYPSAFYLCHACEQYCTLDQITSHISSQEHYVNYFSYTNPDELCFSWIPGMNMKGMLALKLEQEGCKRKLRYLQVLNLPNELINKCLSNTYTNVMQTLSENVQLIVWFDARQPKRVMIQDYQNNSSRKHPLIGMQHVIECVCVGAGEMRHYLCTLCCLPIANHMIINHILSFDHIHCYFKVWHPSTLMSKESYNNYRSIAPVILNIVEQIRETHGTENTPMKQVSLQPDEFKTVNFTCYEEALKKLETITKSSLTTSIKPEKKLEDHGFVSQPQVFSELLKVKLRCQDCNEVFETIRVYLKHFSQLQHQNMLTKHFQEAVRQDGFDQNGKFILDLFTYVCNTLKNKQLPHGTDLVVACVSSHKKADPFYICFACHECFPQPLIKEHFESRKHLINTLMYQNPWRLPFAWKDNELDDDKLSLLAWKEEEEAGRDQIILKVFDIPYSIFWTLNSSDYKQVMHKLQLYHTLLRREVPPCKTFSKLQRNEKFPLLGKPFMVTHALKDKEVQPEVGTLCLLCERRLFSCEIQAHVFSREHVTRFLNRIHPGSLNSGTDSEETFLDLAKQAARIHPVSNMQFIQLETPIWEPCSYSTVKLILSALKRKEGAKSLEPMMKPMMKLVSRVAQAQVDQNREKEGQKNSMAADKLENKEPKRVKLEVKVEEAAESCKNTQELKKLLKSERKRPNATPEKSPKEKSPNVHLGQETTPKRPRLSSSDDSSPKKPVKVPKSSSKPETSGGSNRISATCIELRCVGRDTVVLCGSCSLKVDGIGHFAKIKHQKMHPVVVNLNEKAYNDISNQSFHSVIQMPQIQMLVAPRSDGGRSFSSASPLSAGAAVNTSATRHCEDNREVVDMEINSDSEGSVAMPDSSATTETSCKRSQDRQLKSNNPRAGLVQPHRPTITTTTTSLPPKYSEIVSPDTTVTSLKFETAPEKASTTSVCKSASKETKTVSDTSTESVSTKDKTASEVKSGSGAKVSSRNGPRSEAASKSSAAASAANVAKPPAKHVDASSPSNTAHVKKSMGEHANSHKRNSPTALSPNATVLSSSEHKNLHKDPPNVSATTKTPAATLPKVGRSQLIIVVCEGKQQVYCRLCSVKLNSSSQYHLTSTDHHLKYMKMKFPEWTAKESELEKKLSHMVALLAKIEKDLPQTQNPQKLEVSKEEYFNLGRLSEKKAVEKVMGMMTLKDSHDSGPVVDASGPLKQEICSPCEVSSSDDGMLVSCDETMRCDQSEQEDENQHQTAVVQLPEMESSELEDEKLAAGDFIRDQILGDDDDGMERCITKPVYTPGVDSEVVTEIDSDTNVEESPAADQLLGRHVDEEVQDQQNPILHPQSEAITEAKVVNHSRGSEHLFAPERQRRNSDSSGQQNQSPEKPSPVQLCSIQLQTAAAEEQNRSGSSSRAEPAEQSVSQAQPMTLVGGRARGSSYLSLYLKARQLEAKHVIGIASVWECRGFENLKTFFLCESCMMTLSRQDICLHMVSFDHQLKYLMKYHSEVMYWQELDLPATFKKKIFLNEIVQPISEREMTLKRDAQCFVLSPELHKLVWTSPFDKALKIMKDLKAKENPSVFQQL